LQALLDISQGFLKIPNNTTSYGIYRGRIDLGNERWDGMHGYLRHFIFLVVMKRHCCINVQTVNTMLQKSSSATVSTITRKVTS